MIDRTHLNLISQIIDGMSEILEKLDDSYKNKSAETFEMSKKTLMEFHEKLSRELGGRV